MHKRLTKEWSWNNLPILLPLAFEQREWNAVQIAFYLAEYCGAPVKVFHVETAEDEQFKIEGFLTKLRALAKRLRIRCEIKVEKLDDALPSRVRIARAITSKAKEEKVQAIIMPAHRESYFTELFGRIADKVARKADCKVILVETPYAGVTLPHIITKILIPVLKKIHPEPFIIASALTSSATGPDVEMLAAKVVRLPETTPIDAVEFFKQEERDFSASVSEYIKYAGRLFLPRIVVVRDIGEDLAQLAREMSADLIIFWSERPSTIKRLLSMDELSIVKKAPCVSLVIISDMK
jgi:nucleotide-binding universal stress UspA family protein